MASNGIIFFGLGSVFGGLLSAAVMSSWPEPVQVAIERRPGSEVTNLKAGSEAVEPSVSCQKGSTPMIWSALAQRFAKVVQEQDSEPGLELESAPQDEEEDLPEWTKADDDEFVASQEALYQVRHRYVDMIREELVDRAELSKQEHERFVALVDEVSAKLDAVEKKMESLVGPLPSIESDPNDPNADFEPPVQEVNRREILKQDLAMTQALLDAQTRYEELMGEERFKGLDARFRSVEAFIKEPSSEPSRDFSVKGG